MNTKYQSNDKYQSNNKNNFINEQSTPQNCFVEKQELFFKSLFFNWLFFIFILIFWIIWTTIILANTSDLFTSKLTADPPKSLLLQLYDNSNLLPFIFADFMMIAVIAGLLFGYQTGTLNPDGFTRELHLFGFRWTTFIPLKSIKKFRITKNASYRQNGQPATCVEIVNSQAPFKFLNRFSSCPLHEWIVKNGNNLLRQLNGDTDNPESIGVNSRYTTSEYDDNNLSVNAMSALESGREVPAFDESEDDSDEKDYDSDYDSDSDEEDDDYDDYDQDEDSDDNSDSNDEDEDDEDEELLVPEDIDFPISQPVARVPLPSDSCWKKTENFGSVELSRCGKFSMAFFTLLFSCLFWNGIVSVFIAVLFGFISENKNTNVHNSSSVTTAQQKGAAVDSNVIAPTVVAEKKTFRLNNKEVPMYGKEWWFMFCFLIPFEVIGLVFIYGVLSHLFAPFTKQIWIFSRHDLNRRRTLFGLGFSRTISLAMLKNIRIAFNGAANQPDAYVLLQDNNSEVICRINGVTADEARWLVGEIRAVVR